MLEELDGVKFSVAVNGQHLKKYFPRCGMVSSKANATHQAMNRYDQ
jgi:hypothetical protein